jgi:hypothetical protein
MITIASSAGGFGSVPRGVPYACSISAWNASSNSLEPPP